MCFIIFTVHDFTNKSKGWVGKLSPTRVSHSGKGGMEVPHLMIFFENPPFPPPPPSSYFEEPHPPCLQHLWETLPSGGGRGGGGVNQKFYWGEFFYQVKGPKE